MITAARELDTVSGALDGGAADYLIKPFEFPQLQRQARGVRGPRRGADLGVRRRPVTDRLAVRKRGRSRRDRRRDELPKGLGAVTGQLVLDAVRSAGEVSAAECAELVGISRVSARRYLEHYLEHRRG